MDKQPELEEARDIIVDNTPDERGNVMVAVTIKRSQSMIALQFNAN